MNTMILLVIILIIILIMLAVNYYLTLPSIPAETCTNEVISTYLEQTPNNCEEINNYINMEVSNNEITTPEIYTPSPEITPQKCNCPVCTNTLSQTILANQNLISNSSSNQTVTTDPRLESFSMDDFVKERFTGFNNTKISNIPSEVSFKKIIPNYLYYGLPCNYIKNDTFYDTLKELNFKITNDITQASLIVPCTYENTENEIMDLEKSGIKKSIYGDGVRIFMLNNTDFMVSKLALWKFLKQRYGDAFASTMIPYTWDLTDDNEVDIFKKKYDKNKIYLTKNNKQRQEGIQIHSSLQSILDSRNEYILVQELLQDPYLINVRKINLRVYVLVIRDNYGNIKLQIYKDGFMYYTPDLFQTNQTTFGHNITTGYVDRKIYEENPLTHFDFRSFLDDPKRSLTHIEEYYRKAYPDKKLSDYIFSQIYQLIAFIFQIYEDIIGVITYGVSFQMYGVDIAINDKLKPMIMEINKGPDITAKDTRDRELKMNLSKDILKSVEIIPNVNNNFFTVLELVNINGKLLPINNFIEY